MYELAYSVSGSSVAKENHSFKPHETIDENKLIFYMRESCVQVRMHSTDKYTLTHTHTPVTHV